MNHRLPKALTGLLVILTYTLYAVPYFWVGDGGNWSDPAHWAFNSGGAGGAGIPGLGDDVFFDASSFSIGGQEVVVDVNVIFTNMDWTGVTNSPQMTGTSAFEITTEGSVTFSPDMLHDFMGDYTFISDLPGNTITSAGQTFWQEVFFRGTGEWTLQDPLQVNLAIQIIEGTFISNNQAINAFTFFSDTQLNRDIRLGTSMITIEQRAPGNPSSLILGGDNLTWSGGNTSFEFIGTSSFIDLNGPTAFDFGNLNFTADNSLIRTSTTTRPSIAALQFMFNGEIQGDLTIIEWTLSMGQTVFLSNGSRQVVRDIITGDDCDGLASLIVRNNIGANATIEFSRTPSSISGLFLKGVEADTPDGRTVLLFASQDGGNNGNLWVIQDLPSRDLYWVGGTGDWNDRNNWAATSGGAGGECIPKPNDNIFFDNNSFNNPTDVVSGITPAFANNLTWDATNFTAVEIRIPELYINNDITLTTLLNWNIPDVYLVGNDEAGSSSNTDFQVINTGPNTLINLIMQSNRKVVLDAALMLSGELNLSTSLEGNTFDSDRNRITAQSMVAVDNPISLILDRSIITITGPRVGLDMPVTIGQISSLSGSDTRWIFTAEDSGISSDRGPLGNLNFEGETGLAIVFSNGVIQTNSISFSGDGQFSGEEVRAVGVSLSAGHTYTFDTGTEHTIGSVLAAPGTICSPINIMSDVNGVQVTISADPLFNSVSGTIPLSYLNIRDIAIVGANEAFAGIGSADLGNNSGWTFPSSAENEDVQKFLGPDQVACEDATITLQPFQTTEISRIIWVNDSSNTIIFEVPVNTSEVIATAFFPDGCSLTDTVAFDFQPSFTVDLGQDSTICEGENLRLDATTAGANYLWNTGDTTAQIVPTLTGDFIVNVDRAGCTDIDTVNISIIDIEDFSLPADTVLCENTSLVIAAPPISIGTFEWNNGTNDASISVFENTTVWIEVSQDRCTLRDSLEVTFDPDFVLELGNDTTICEGQTLTLSPLAGLDSYNWSDSSTDPTLEVVTSGNYNLQASRGVCNNTASIDVNVSVIEPFSIGQDTTQCLGNSINITVPDNVTLPSIWSDNSFGDTLNITSSGTYWLEVQEANCTRRDSLEVVFETPFDLDLGNDQTACAGDTIILDASSANADNYNWNIGSDSDILTVTSSNAYILTADRGACTEVDTVQITYLDLDALNLGEDRISCVGETISFDGSLPGITNYQWTELNSGNGISTDPNIDITTDGIYLLSASSQGCSTTDTVAIQFDPAISFNGLGMDSTLCQGDELNYNLPFNDVDITWSDGSNNPQFTISTAGTYTVDLERGGCQISDSIEVQIRQLPMASLVDTETACQGATVILNATTTNVNYTWSTGETTPTINITTPDTYVVTLTDDQCSNTDSTVVTFVEAPVINLRNDTTICEGISLQLDPMNDQGGLDYRWSTGELDETITVTDANDYKVTVSNSDNCSSVDSFRLSVNETPIFELPETASACEGDAASLMVTVSSDNFIWSTGETAETINVSTTSLIWAEASIGTCVFRDSTEVTISPIPIVMLPGDTSICDESVLNLDVTIANATYLWSTGETSNSIAVTDQGSYDVNVTVDGCSASDEINVSINPLPTIELGNDQTICQGETVNLNAGGGAWTTEWSTGVTTPQINVSEPGTVRVTADLNGCIAEDEVVIDVQELPEFNLGEDISRCEQFSATLLVDRDDVDVLWSTGDIGRTLEVSDAGTYTATAMTDIGCTFVDAISVTDRECSRFSIYVPNAFAPDSQGENKQFYVSPSDNATIISYDMRIFDRWGGLLFSTNDINAKWDGRTPNFGLQPGVYTYAIEVRFSDDFEADRTDYMSGSFTLIR